MDYCLIFTDGSMSPNSAWFSYFIPGLYIKFSEYSIYNKLNLFSTYGVPCIPKAYMNNDNFRLLFTHETTAECLSAYNEFY